MRVPQAFRTLGYEVCENERLETGFEKIAIYAEIDGELKHAARQLESGRWTSKLGGWEDIEHSTLAALEGKEYGRVMRLMKRLRRPI